MKKNIPATLMCDFYKISHREQYPKGTEMIYATWTPRGSRRPNVNEVVAFGFQRFIKEFLIDYFNENFFKRTEQEVVEEYVRVIKYTLGVENPDASHIVELHKLGYLPIAIYAVPEGTKVPLRCPMLTIENTLPKFFWLTNYLESLMSSELWLGMTSATIANEYRELLDKYAELTGSDKNLVQFQGHDFSYRGMTTSVSAEKSGSGHLLSFTGTDTIPAILALENYYGANIEKELVGCSIPASEHSTMCANTNGETKDEYDSYKRILTEIYPNGFVSVVSDTWDLWKVITETLQRLKNEIMGRNGRLVIRPDSGDPVKIVTGYKIDEFDEGWVGSECVKVNGKYYTVKITNQNRDGWTIDKELSENEVKGVIELLWEIFGGTVNEKGFKVLDSHIGCIYGDAITVERCESINKRMMDKGFASINMVYGIGSYTYQMNTRDTFGFAMKTTYAIINGEEKMLYKDPKTDDGLKKSQKGLVIVYEENGEVKWKDGYLKDNWGEDVLDKEGVKLLLLPIFIDGCLLKETTLKEIRDRLSKN